MCGESQWQYEETEDGPKISNIIIYLDERRDGHVRLIIHELLHIYSRVYMNIYSQVVDDLEEGVILQWEAQLYSYLHAPHREKLLESWSKAIQRKL